MTAKGFLKTKLS